MNKPTPDPSAAGWQAGFEQWADQLARLNRSADPFGIGASMARVAQSWLAHPAELATALADLTRELQNTQLNEWQVMAGLQPRAQGVAAADDERLSHPAGAAVPARPLP